MKKSIKYVVVLCMLVVMMMPSVAFAAEKPCYGDLGQVGLKINAEQLQNLCSKNNVSNLKKDFDFQMLKDTCGKLTGAQQGTDCTGFTGQKACKDFTGCAPANLTCGNQAKNTNCNQTGCTPADLNCAKNTNCGWTPQKPADPSTPVVPEKPAVPAEPSTPNASEEPSDSDDSNSPAGSYEAQVADLVNKERAAQGLSALKFNAELSKVAEAKAADLRDKNYFSHTSPTYGSPFDMMKSFGIDYTAAGENIAKGYMSPSSVMNGWMNSSGHRANILNSNFTEIGVGYVTDGSGTGYWVQMFIRP